MVTTLRSMFTGAMVFRGNIGHQKRYSGKRSWMSHDAYDMDDCELDGKCSCIVG